MGLQVGLTYNLKSDCPREMLLNEDASAEYESQETVEGIVAALEELGHQVTLLPYNSTLPRKLECLHPDLVFNIAEGWYGRNREALVPALLEFYSIPYTGSDPLTLSLTLDKSLCKQVANAAGSLHPKASWSTVRLIRSLTNCSTRCLLSLMRKAPVKVFATGPE